MAESLEIITGSKDAIYTSLVPQIKALIHDETDRVANLANVSAALKEAFGFLWVGFYLVKSDELVLGPFQGPNCMYTDSKRKRCLWYKLAKSGNNHC